MLVLSRPKNASILVTLPTNQEQLLALAGQTILVKVVNIRGGVVRIGFEAPKQVNIARTELVTSESFPNVVDQKLHFRKEDHSNDDLRLSHTH